MTAFDDNLNLKWLFCLTHPDDEIFIASWIKQLTSKGCQVYLSWTHHTHLRKKESILAAKILGVPEENLFFLDGRDGYILEDIPNLQDSFNKIIQDIKPDRIACGAFEQGHIDHDATNFMVNQIYDGPIFEIPFYHTYLTMFPKVGTFLNRDNIEVRYLNSSDRITKKNVLNVFRSQSIKLNILAYELKEKLLLNGGNFFKREEMRLQTHKNFMRPNYPDAIGELLKQNKVWARWIDVISKIS